MASASERASEHHPPPTSRRASAPRGLNRPQTRPERRRSNRDAGSREHGCRATERPPASAPDARRSDIRGRSEGRLDERAQIRPACVDLVQLPHHPVIARDHHVGPGRFESSLQRRARPRTPYLKSGRFRPRDAERVPGANSRDTAPVLDQPRGQTGGKRPPKRRGEQDSRLTLVAHGTIHQVNMLFPRRASRGDRYGHSMPTRPSSRQDSPWRSRAPANGLDEAVPSLRQTRILPELER